MSSKIFHSVIILLIILGCPSAHSTVQGNHVPGDSKDVNSPAWFAGRIEGNRFYASGQNPQHGILKDIMAEDVAISDSLKLAGLGSPASPRERDGSRSFPIYKDDKKIEHELAVYHPNSTGYIYPNESDPPDIHWNWKDVVILSKIFRPFQESASIFLFGTGIVGLTGVIRRRLRIKKG